MNNQTGSKLGIIKWLGVVLILHVMATGCASTVRDPFAKEWVATAVYQERLTTKYRPWYNSLTEEQKLQWQNLWTREAELGLAQMKLGAQMMQGGPIY
jgi:hypothetical protein